MSTRTTDSAVAERQAPLRDLYEREPREALTRKTARSSTCATAASDPVHGDVEVGGGYGTFVRYGLDRYVGGLHDAPNPGDLLCAALAACADGTIRMIANLLAIELVELEVEVSGELDVRGCLNVNPDVRVGFEELDCRVRLKAAAGTDPAQLKALGAAAERFCVNLDTLRGGVAIRTDFETVTEAR